MAFVPLTITAGPIEDSALNTNLSNMRKYTNGQIVAGDLAADWCTHRQLMSGKYNGTTNTMNFLSGVQGGKIRTAPRELVTYLSRYNTCRNQGASLTLFQTLWLQSLYPGNLVYLWFIFILKPFRKMTL